MYKRQNLDESKPEIKVMNAIIDLLDDMSYSITDMEDLYDELSAQVDEIDPVSYTHLYICFLTKCKNKR